VRETGSYVHGRGCTVERPGVVEVMTCITAVGLHPVASWVGGLLSADEMIRWRMRGPMSGCRWQMRRRATNYVVPINATAPPSAQHRH
jgi:hypothetical protein